jgi:hypothetical protein
MVKSFPDTVRGEIGAALYQGQLGGKHVAAKPLRDIGSGILEVVSDHLGQHISRGLFGKARWQSLCAPCFSEEVEVRNSDTEARDRAGQAAA